MDGRCHIVDSKRASKLVSRFAPSSQVLATCPEVFLEQRMCPQHCGKVIPGKDPAILTARDRKSYLKKPVTLPNMGFSYQN